MSARERDAVRLGDVAEKEAKRLRMRRFTYYRNRHARLDDPRLRLAGQMAAAPLYLVEAFVQRLDAFASANTPRGSIEGFSIEACALQWTVRDELLARLYVALEDPRVGWIDNDFVVDFWSENPDTDDPTANERADRSRKFRKAFSELARQARVGLIDAAERARREAEVLLLRERAREHIVSWAQWKAALPALIRPPDARAPLSQRDSVTVTPRSDQNLTNSGTSVENRAGGATGESTGTSMTEQAGPDSIDPQAAQAQVWLKSRGKLLVIQRLGVTPGRAETLLERWLARAAGSHRDLAEIIAGAAAPDLSGKLRNAAQFELSIGESCDRRRELIDRGPMLAMGPAAAPREAAAQRELPSLPAVFIAERKRG